MIKLLIQLYSKKIHVYLIVSLSQAKSRVLKINTKFVFELLESKPFTKLNQVVIDAKILE